MDDRITKMEQDRGKERQQISEETRNTGDEQKDEK